MVVISVSLNFPYPARVTLGEASERARLPSAKERFLGGARKKFERRPLLRLFKLVPGGSEKAERRHAAGRRKAPKRDPEQRTGYEAEGTHWTESDSFHSAADVRSNRSPDLLAIAPSKDG